MTQEEKQLLLRDLCGRQFYGTKVLSPWEKDGPCKLSAIDLTSSWQIRVFEDWFKVEDIKPYLRPMSSMTEDEKKELSERYVWKINGSRIEIKYHSDGYWDDDIHCPTEEYLWLLDWLNAHHFDYRGLIPMGLALEAKEGMYRL